MREERRVHWWCTWVRWWSEGLPSEFVCKGGSWQRGPSSLTENGVYLYECLTTRFILNFQP